MKTAREFWKEKFGEYPQTDADKLAVAMMTKYGHEQFNKGYDEGNKDATNEAIDEIEENYSTE